MKILLVPLFIFAGFFVQAQSIGESKFHLYGKYSFGGIDTAFYHNYSLTGEWLVHKNIGLNYNVDLILRNDEVHHIHTTMGLLGGPFLILSSWGSNADSSSGSFVPILGILLLALPDGVSFHIPIRYRWDLSPYANVLGLDFVKNRAIDEFYIKYACSFGIRTNYIYRERFTLNGFVETRKTAGMKWGFGLGLGAGILFGTRE